ncbi:MAG: insulinase family protein [Bacteroidia bacterium]
MKLLSAVRRLMHLRTALTMPLCLAASILSAQDLSPVSAVPIEVGPEIAPRPTTEVTKTVLPNGFEVYLHEDHTSPSIFGAVAVKAGGKYDPKDATGMGHYLEHMLFKGTTIMGTSNYAQEKPYLDKIDGLYEELGKTTDPTQRSAIQKQINENAVAAAAFAIPNELDRMLESIGSEGVNAFTNVEQIVYHNSFPPNQVEKWLDIYAARFQNPVFRLFQSELETVYEEKNRAMDEFTYAIYRKVSTAFFKNHPYGQQDILGETDHLKNPSLTKMYEYFNTYYVANNMALVMSGDFNTKAVLPMIEKKFGVLKPGEVPKYPEYPEAPFNGREYISGKYTPVKAGILGFRTAPNGHPDGPVLDIVNHLLFNSGETGLLNKLQLDHKVLAVIMIPMTFNDHGGNWIAVIPKIIGQSTENAEGLVLAELAKLRQGQFSDAALQAAKLKLDIQFERNLESNNNFGLLMADAFIQGRSWKDVVSYPDRIGSVTKEQVIAAANKYYGPNYLMFESKMGFPKKEKLEKPGFVAPKPAKEAVSEYGQHFQALGEEPSKPRFVDFRADLTTVNLGPNALLFHVENPIDEIFEYKIRWGVGTSTYPILTQAAEYMNLVGAGSMSTDSLKRSMEVIGCEYTLDAEPNYTVLECSGPEKYLAESLKLLAQLITSPAKDDKQIETIEDGAKSERKFEGRSLQSVGEIAFRYALYGANSINLKRLNLKQIKALSAAELITAFTKAIDVAVEVHYSGRKQSNTVAELFRNTFFMGKYPSQSAQYVDHPITQYKEPTVVFLERGDAIQTQLYFMKDGPKFSREIAWMVDCFNEYFGGSMAGLVFQEIREFRSLAYTARARILAPQVPDRNYQVRGYIGCQADKTIEAMTVMNDLLLKMPAKPERIPTILKSAQQSTTMARPAFRTLTQTVVDWRRLGYTTDPSADKYSQYAGLTWEALEKFYHEQIQSSGSPVVWVLTGDPKRIGADQLSKFGKVIRIKESDVHN